jgi:CubicO group peptidase (beta-lactamase class C family)
MMGRRVAVAMLVCWADLVSAQSNAVANANPARWVDSIFAPYSRLSTPGCAVGVVQNGLLTVARAYGAADLFHRVPNTTETAFYVASLSKQFTAMSVVLLAQDGKITLDDDVRKWVPEVPKLGHITLLQLLEHTSGLRDYYTLLGISGWRGNELLTEKGFLDLVSRQKALNFKPGNEFLYSNTGYALLAVVVKRASGKSLRDFAAARIFKPLGMTRTQFRDDHTTLIDDEAIGYVPGGRGYSVSIPQVDVVGDGGVYTTVEDLARWDSNLDSGVVGGKAGVTMLQAPGRLNDGTSTGYALGLNIGTFNGSRLVSHSGSYGGYRSTFMRFPDEHVAVIALCNVAAPSSSLAEQVANLYLPQAYSVGDGGSSAMASLFSPRASSQLSGRKPVGARDIQEPDEQVWLEGKYYSDELDMEVTLRSRNAQLVMERPVGDSLHFARVARDVFMSDDQITLQVERDGLGVVSSFLLSSGRVRGLRFVKRSGIGGSG